jgi:hypothetical protein
MKSDIRFKYEVDDLDTNFEIEWNRSATFNVYRDEENVDCFTNYSAKTIEQAQAIADEWLYQQLKEERKRV